MKKHTKANATVAAAVDRAWAPAVAADHVSLGFGTGITTCDLQGLDAYAKCFCVFCKGADRKERSIEAYHYGKSFGYAIDQCPLPVSGVVVSIGVVDFRNAKTRTTWCAEYGVKDAHAELVDQILSGFDAQNSEAGEAYCTSAPS